MAFEHDAQRLVAAVNGVTEHPSAENPGVERRLHHGDADLGLGGERNVVGNSSRLPALAVFDPVLWQIETAVDQSVSSWARVAKEDADLAVLDPPGRAAVLARNPDRMAALLQEPGLVENQHT